MFLYFFNYQIVRFSGEETTIEDEIKITLVTINEPATQIV
jgi:sRNA-binding carbon storage regulator CsrA